MLCYLFVCGFGDYFSNKYPSSISWICCKAKLYTSSTKPDMILNMWIVSVSLLFFFQRECWHFYSRVILEIDSGKC